MSTSEALMKLTRLEARQVCLVQGGRFSALVTYDTAREELVFRMMEAERPLTVRGLLFNTEPAWVL